jgi:hypothetical protein
MRVHAVECYEQTKRIPRKPPEKQHGPVAVPEYDKHKQTPSGVQSHDRNVDFRTAEFQTAGCSYWRTSCAFASLRQRRVKRLALVQGSWQVPQALSVRDNIGAGLARELGATLPTKKLAEERTNLLLAGLPALEALPSDGIDSRPRAIPRLLCDAQWLMRRAHPRG